MHFETLSEISSVDMSQSNEIYTLSTPISKLYGSDSKAELETGRYSVDSEEYWKLKIASLVSDKRCNINLVNGSNDPSYSLDLYVYDRLLEGMTSWKEYYKFLIGLIIEHAQKDEYHHLIWIHDDKEFKL